MFKNVEECSRLNLKMAKISSSDHSADSNTKNCPSNFVIIVRIRNRIIVANTGFYYFKELFNKNITIGCSL